MIDFEKMTEQERKDYIIAQQIFINIFAKYDKNLYIYKTKTYSSYDMFMRCRNKKYLIEIKERNQDMKKYKTLPLKWTKYIDIVKETGGEDTPIVIYLVNGEDFYIFDLNKLDLNKCEYKNWEINKIEYSVMNNSNKERQPTIFMPISMAVYKGKFNGKNAYN